jgi:activator of 2-hydroxyglutaryl-CoA dehydratase
MINRVFFKEGIVLIGGVAKNQCMLTILKEQSGLPILIPDDSQRVVPLSAALLAG